MTDVFKLIEEHGLTLHGDIEHFAELICMEQWRNVTDDALLEEVRRRGFPIRDAQISPKIKDEYELCCQKYDSCKEPCTPRGRHLAKREWVGLTEADIYDAMDNEDEFDFARAIEAKLKEKNT